MKKTKEEKKKYEIDFINKAKIVHEDKYDYSKVEYKKAIENVIINCPIHGEFYQNMASHLKGLLNSSTEIKKNYEKIIKYI